jgi:hypothetical protein
MIQYERLYRRKQQQAVLEQIKKTTGYKETLQEKLQKALLSKLDVKLSENNLRIQNGRIIYDNVTADSLENVSPRKDKYSRQQSMTGIKRAKKNSQMDGSPGVDRERGETGSTMIDNMNALVNQDFKDFEGRPIKRKLD